MSIVSIYTSSIDIEELCEGYMVDVDGMGDVDGVADDMADVDGIGVPSGGMGDILEVVDAVDFSVIGIGDVIDVDDVIIVTGGVM